MTSMLSKNCDISLRGEVNIHLELAFRFFEEGVKVVDKDLIQASEKLYKSVEECVKACAKFLQMEDIIERVRSRGRWTVTDLEKAVQKITEKLGEDVRLAWDAANYLHVWGFHEAKLDVEAVKLRISNIEKALKLVKKFIERNLKTE